jgi:phosphoribosylformylglycinamidine (FGAM) synthase-like enzyme
VACHDISDGGIAVALAEMAIGGDVGCDVSLPRTGRLRSDAALFSESNSRWVLEVRKGKEKMLPKDRRTRLTKIGVVGGDSLAMRTSRALVDTKVDKLASSFGSTLWRMV